MGVLTLLRTLGRWVWRLPNNAIGFVAGWGGSTYRDHTHRTTVNVGGWLPMLMYRTTRTPALALGDFILTPDKAFLDSRTYAHELGHTDQYRKLGPLFLPLYGLGALLGKRRGDAHDANPFEVDADVRSGIANKYENTFRFWSSVDRTLPHHRSNNDVDW